jgi:hypothetical protein
VRLEFEGVSCSQELGSGERLKLSRGQVVFHASASARETVRSA